MNTTSNNEGRVVGPGYLVGRSLLALGLAAGLALGTLGCSDDSGAPDSGVQADKGGSTDGAPADKGKPQPDTGKPQPDTGKPQPDTGKPQPDKGPPPPLPKCEPGLNAGSACGGNVVGKWTYKAGCVDPKAFDALKTSCPGASVSNTGYTMDAGLHSLNLKADKSFIRAVKGKVTGKLGIPKLCAMAVGGCTGIATAAKILFPAANINCKATPAGGCDCSVTMPVATLDQGTYTVNGGKVTAKVGGKSYDYYVCVKSGALLYKGTETNPIDKIVSYVLTK